MNQSSYEHLELVSGKKKLFIFVCLATNSSSSLSLNSIIKRVKLKYNNLFVNKLVNLRIRFNYV